MIIPPEILKCVVFVGAKKANGEYEFFGSAFILGFGGTDRNAAQVFFVTARHVVDAIKRKGATEVWLRVNLKNGESAWVQTSLTSWFRHPNDNAIDVAILELGFGPDVDHLVFPNKLLATDEIMRANEVGLGDEVLITGLFRHHKGARRNIPIVRIGNLSCVSEERIRTEDFGEIEGYLVEARSIGGLSGSPVFLNLGMARVIDGQLGTCKIPAIFFLGIIHGHFDVKKTSIDVEQQSELTSERINTGIAIVTPFRKIEEVISIYRQAHPQTKAFLIHIERDKE